MLKTLDLRDEGLRAELGLRTVLGASQKSKRQEKRSAEQALKLIQEFVVDHPSCTRLEISRGINRAKSPHVRAQIEWLVYNGVLARTQIIRPEGTIEYRYVYVGESEENS